MATLRLLPFKDPITPIISSFRSYCVLKTAVYWYPLPFIANHNDPDKDFCSVYDATYNFLLARRLRHVDRQCQTRLGLVAGVSVEITHLIITDYVADAP